MLIEFYCTNITEFDAATGRQKSCGNRLIVSDDQIGQMVDCEKCGNTVEVPFESVLPKKKPERTPRKKQKPAVAATKNTKAKVKKRRPSKKINEKNLADPVDGIRADVMTFEFEQNKVQSLYDTVEKRCPKCGSLMADGRCTKCRFVEPVYESSFMPLDQIKMRPAGFQRWFCQIFNEGVSIRLIEIGAHLLLGLLAAIIALACVLVGGTSGFFGLIVLAAAAFFYVAFVYKGHQLTKNPRAKLAWFQKPIWNLLLYGARSMKWTQYDSRLKGRPVIDRRKAPIVDEKIPYLEGISRCQVLDLEGTLVTDKGLRYLYGLSNLNCLVLRKTKVTHEGVLRLQQANPRLWIWY